MEQPRFAPEPQAAEAIQEPDARISRLREALVRADAEGAEMLENLQNALRLAEMVGDDAGTARRIIEGVAARTGSGSPDDSNCRLILTLIDRANEQLQYILPRIEV
jgi:hypothetical protein